MATSPRLAPTPIRDNAIVHHMAVLAALGSGSPEAARAAMDADVNQTADDLRIHVIRYRGPEGARRRCPLRSAPPHSRCSVPMQLLR